MAKVIEDIAARARIPFKNESFTDFSKEEHKRAQAEAIEQVKSELGRTYPLIIGGKKITTQDTFASVNPSQPDQVIGYFARATVEQANEAVRVAAETFEKWQYVPAEERAGYLFAAADLMRQRRFIINAWMIYEVGKSWVEADADTAEAIDFLEFYAREALRLAGDHPITQVDGEDNKLVYIPLGVGAVIPPWNFPCAIMVGMTSAAFVSGNTVILKPASTSPAIAYQFIRILEEVGLPAGVVNFLTGSGAVVGDTLVDNPKTRFIAFTGSRDVGLRIYERASKVHKGQRWLKRSILEMGGKDAVVVDETADLDAAANGIVTSAFGFQGQKCSAGSRAIIVEQVYDQIVQKVLDKARQLSLGDVTRPDTYMGPVVDESAMRKILEYIEIGKNEGRLVLGGSHKGPGYFIEPTIFADVDPQARIAQEEIFGPVLAIIKAKDFADALHIANDTEYGLTGAVFTNKPERIEQAQKEYHVGNLYFNRKCTGALVGVQPFGGFNMSGTDSKAGGKDYLLLFTQAKSIATKK
ncbi:L-glutamate gamma-semialdehyde dehydrogenase [Ktedonosporobacter rubrisoli]|uniref:L-glutamate gamma-semialdehyde dehydrogenase n=1 Tax=Ktedonosporobacter rubrisoli TaxID=2509675 RepID=A0A4P6JS61_KTERU|nr:L-glutamate gamma-semialdehyde dehydrogenase [Ktedonosporobacter rubrisoli]QBD78368.1 L-glutamate gamma-semialdehyde dehydrogenase [Ktedonosporobacter rubrisoli]